MPLGYPIGNPNYKQNNAVKCEKNYLDAIASAKNEDKILFISTKPCIILVF